MTIVQPPQKSILNILLIIVFLLFVVANVILIIFYNYALNLEHKIQKGKQEIKEVENLIISAKEELIYRLSAENLKKLAEERGLIEEKSPQYLKIEENKWQIGLNF